MNDETIELMLDAVGRLERQIQAFQCPAVVVLDGARRLALFDYDYLLGLESVTAFEVRAAAKARETGTSRWVLATPATQTTATGRLQRFRGASGVPLEPGEQEVIIWTAYDQADGLDYGFVPFTRRPNGEPVFDEPGVMTGPVWPEPHWPGRQLLAAFLES